jgi:hypothetical protein
MHPQAAARCATNARCYATERRLSCVCGIITAILHASDYFWHCSYQTKLIENRNEEKRSAAFFVWMDVSQILLNLTPPSIH